MAHGSVPGRCPWSCNHRGCIIERVASVFVRRQMGIAARVVVVDLVVSSKAGKLTSAVPPL